MDKDNDLNQNNNDNENFNAILPTNLEEKFQAICDILKLIKEDRDALIKLIDEINIENNNSFHTEIENKNEEDL